jgi:6-phosphogluconolactonase (cycloisomerase 2 family)
MAVIKTHQFLPEIFQTETNKKFLNATLDQLVNEPSLKKINGYIGRKLAPSYKINDSYILENNKERQNYQLEPSLIIKNSVTGEIEFATTYIDLINKLRYHGGLVDNHNRLFDNEYYTYDPKIDLDKFVNFSQYYWLPNGPDPVTVTANGVKLQQSFTVTYDSVQGIYKFSEYGETPNPTLTLARGGTYDFVINEPGNEFFIQSRPGANGLDPSFLNLTTRQVLGVTNNGADVGTIRFTVPSSSAQSQWTSMPLVDTVDYATTLGFHQLLGANPEELISSLGGIDGPVRYLDNASVVFTNVEYIDDTFWNDSARIEDGIVYFDENKLIPFSQRTGIFTIKIERDQDNVERIVLFPKLQVANEHKVKIKGGQTYAGREFYSRLNLLTLVPFITAPQDFLFYQSGENDDASGLINLVAPTDSVIDPLVDIIGRTEYKSPNGITFTNGLKVKFDSSALAQWQNTNYYVEGVGSAIVLIPESDLVSIESINSSTVLEAGQDYVIGDRLNFTGGTGTADATVVVKDIVLDTATAIASINSTTGVVNNITIVNGGSGYLSAPAVTIDSAPTGNPSAFAHAVISNGVVTNIIIDAAGLNYTSPPTVTIAPPTSGPIKDFFIKDRGTYSILPQNPVKLEGGSGSEALLNAYLQPVLPDYITIKRSSLDRNPWSRANRWFHMDVIEKTAEYNGRIAIYNQNSRASRPIIEFNDSLQLFNFGAEAKQPVDILDTTIQNAFTQVQGVICVDETTLTIGNLTLTHGDRVIFSNDINNDVRNKIYNFTIEATTEFPPSVIYKAYIQETDDTNIVERNTVVVLSGTNGGKQWHYNGSLWTASQTKTEYSQEPLFDIINDNGISFGDNLTYSGTTFKGTKIFSYQKGTGSADPVIGFPLSYKNFVSQGDIQFDNNFDSDTFTYLLANGAVETIEVNSGYLQKNLSSEINQRQNIWTINRDFSKQYQNYQFTYDGETNLFPIDNPPDSSVINPNIKITVNNQILNIGSFVLTKVVDQYAILVSPDLIKKDDIIFISIFNKNFTSNKAYYEVPLNLDVNGLNSNLTTLTLGQLRNHLITLKNNSLNVQGSVPGNSNLRDIQYVNQGGSVLQHSAPVVYAGLFLNHPTMNFVDSIKLANREYSKFKIKFIELAGNLELDRDDIPGSVDQIMLTINAVKNDSFPWFYSDMLPYGPNERVIIPTYTVLDPDIKTYEINKIFVDTVISNKSVLVYLTRTINNIEQKTLLIKDRDYFLRQDRPAVEITESFGLLYGDRIDIVEYNNTDGCFVPETPTKMGMYPKYYPEIYTDDTYRQPIDVIQGHDGSIMPAFGDFRDQLILELERRIYNNIKVVYDTNIFNLYDYLPGKFRVTDYSLGEFNQILSQGFLSWIGTNRVDYTTNDYFVASDPFTWNYKKFIDAVNGESSPGSWRSIFKYFYDTDRPHTHPWEMLGFSEKPSYWEDRYGPAPYTGGNSILWSDLSLGYIHDGPRIGFDSRYQRPNLSFMIPVDENGNLRPPTEIGGYNTVTGQQFGLIADFDSTKANTSYAVGDIGPVEAAWRRSSEFPYAIQMALALAKPAKYFSLLANTQNYIRNPITGQFEISATGQHITPTALLIQGYDNNGTIERNAGYLNWIRDYVKNLGIGDAAAQIKENLSELDVQLAYKMAGYTDKRFIELLAEQSSPSSINDSVVVPEENYRIELYKGSPVNKITYSAVIVEKSPGGYTVSGFDLTNPYFFIIPSQVNNNAYSITAGKERGIIYKDFKNAKYTVPYGFEFNSRQQVVDFLVSYQRYLLAQGFIFVDRDNDLKEQKDWILSAKEFLHWSTQGWKSGNIIVLSPVSTELKVFDESSVVDEIKNTPYSSRVLDVNFKPIIKNNFTAYRSSNTFTFKSNANQTIGFAELNLVQFEHLLILDNITVFNDILYVPELGNRQYRLKLVGAKTSGWNGSLELPGFIYSSDKVDEWLPGQDYLKGSIVKYKFRFYTATQNVTASDQFQTNLWKLISSSELRSGVINNFATNAQQGVNFYDIDNQPIAEDSQLFSNGLIGFRNRQYFNNLGIDATTQSKFYQGLIKQKGTVNAINALKGANFNNLETQVNFYENWAVRIGEYGATDVNKFIEIELNESAFSSNPTALQFVDDTVVKEPDVVAFDQSDIFKSAGEYAAKLFAAETNSQPKVYKSLPVAGFVNLDDIDATIFDIEDYETLTTIVNNIGIGYKIWVARDFTKNWNVYRASLIEGSLFALRYIIDDTVEVYFDRDHGLSESDLIVIKNFDSRYDGVYKVISVVDTNRFTITMYQNLQKIKDEQAVGGSGILFQLTSTKINVPSDVESVRPVQGWVENDKIWVNNLDAEQNWGVYNKTSPWKFINKVELDPSKMSGNDNFGQAVSLDPSTGTLLYAGAPNSGTGRAAIFVRAGNNSWAPSSFFWGNSTGLDSYGKVVANGNGYFAVGAPDSQSGTGYVYMYDNGVLIQIITDDTGVATDYFGSAIAMSHDGSYMYIGSPGADKVLCYALVTRTEGAQSIVGTGSATDFTLTSAVDSRSDVVVFATLRSAEYIPTVDYTLTTAANAVIDFTTVGTGATGAGTLTYNNLAATGGTGSGATFTVINSNSGAYSVSRINGGSGYANGDTLTILGSSLGGSAPANNLTITVSNNGPVDNISFVAAPVNFERIDLIRRSKFYKLIGTISGSTPGANFGTSVVTNKDGSVIVVGSNLDTNFDIDNNGKVNVYHRTIAEFTTDGVSGTFNLPQPVADVFRVTFNNQELVQGTDYYLIGSSAIQFPPFATPVIGQKIRVETNNFQPTQDLYPSISGIIGQKFGSAVAVCNTGCNVYVASPYYAEQHYSEGLVTRYVNNGRVYGIVTGTIENPTVVPGDTFVINDRTLTVAGTTLASVISLINAASIPGVQAENFNNKIKITSDSAVANNKLDIKMGVGTVIYDLGIEIYTAAQTIKHPNLNGERFGTALALSQVSGMLAVTSDGADISVPTTFDTSFTLTTFDSNSTTFVALAKDSGAVYIYDLMENPFESQDNPAIFAYTQKLVGPDLDTGFNFGASTSIYNGTLVAGVTNDYNIVSGGGSIYAYYNENNTGGWDLIRYKEKQVDPATINSAFIYNKKQQQIISFFDIYDPAKGKLLGIVDQELDYKEEFDPAAYNVAQGTNQIQNSNFYWSSRHVGKTWFDTSQSSFIEYEQGPLQYREKNWGSLFPGSQVKIYEWVESNFLPSQYTNSGQDGIPKYPDNSAYTSVTIVDPSTGIISQKYYYWVGNKTSVDVLQSKRSLSIQSLEKYISNPKDQNIPYMAALSQNSLALYNISNNLIANDVVLHVDTAVSRNTNLIHNEYQLIQQGNPNEKIPARILNKMKDSLVGFDDSGKIVPDPKLPLENSIGLLIRPRQGIFVNRLSALKNFVLQLNRIFEKNPVLLISNPATLYSEDVVPSGYDAEAGSFTEIEYLDVDAFADGYTILIRNDARFDGRWTLYKFNGNTKKFELDIIQSYKTSIWWSKIDWYSEQYETGKEIKYVVDTYGQILSLNLIPNDYVKILDDGIGNWLIFNVEADLSLTLIAAQNASVQFKDTLYEIKYGAGFDSTVFDIVDFDPVAAKEVGQIFDSVYKEILINSLAIEFNTLFFSIVNFIIGEQKNPDWIFKSSFIDVYHSLRTLEQLPNYIRDNQSFYEDYIKEVKPYRTIIKEFVPQYSKIDEVTGNWADFDLPARYFKSEETFRSPDVTKSSDAALFESVPIYNTYAENYKFKVSGYLLGNVGQNYILPPNVEIVGGGGTGAAAITTINSTTGQLTGIFVTNSGSGYTSIPTVFINGVGEGATAYPLLHNEYNQDGSYNTVRGISTSLKFDRIAYSSNIVEWQPNTAYQSTIVVDGNKANAWNLDRLRYVESTVITSQDNDVTEVFFKGDGTAMYIVGNSTDRIYQYSLNIPWDVSTAANIGAANLAPQDTNVQGLFIKDDGTEMFTIGTNTDSIYQYRLATSWMVNTASVVSSLDISSEESSPRAIELSQDGLNLYILGTLNDTVYQYTMTVPWEISTANYSGKSLSIAPKDNFPTAIRFKTDGSRLYVIGQQSDSINEYNLTTNWDVSTAVFTNSFNLETNTPTGMFVSYDGTKIYVSDSGTDEIRQYNFNSDGIIPIDSNVYITSGNLIYYNNEAYLATNANISSQSIFDFTRYNKVDSGNILLNAADRISAYYFPEVGRPGKDLEQLMFGVGFPGNEIQGKRFDANSFTFTSNIIGFNYTGMKITSANIQAVDFLENGFELDDTIRIRGQYNFDFKNDADFKVISVDHTEMMLSGPPIETIYTITLSSNVTNVQAGDYITQSNTTANAFILHDYADANVIQIIHSVTGFTVSANTIQINGVAGTAGISEIITGGTANVKITNLTIDNLLDSNIASFYKDTALGTRPEDINIVGGSYVDGYHSHAPEELIPGRIYDALEIRTFTNNSSNTATYGFREFKPMRGNIEFYRISANATTMLSANLGVADHDIFVGDVTVLPDPGAASGIPGEIFINGELIHYYQKYDSAKIAAASSWTANTFYSIDSLIAYNSNTYLVLGNVYANSTSYISNSSVRQVFVNTLSQLRRGVDGTGAATLHLANSKVVDTSLVQVLPDSAPKFATVTGNYNTTANVTWRITLGSPITANIGNYLVQSGNTANVRLLGNVVSSNTVAVHFVTGNLTIGSNVLTIFNQLNNTYLGTVANVRAMEILGQVDANGNVTLVNETITQSNLWIPLNTGVGLEGSTALAAQFIREEPSYTP